MTIEEKIIELQNQIDELKAEVKKKIENENKFKRADWGGYYFTINTQHGEIEIERHEDYRNQINHACFDNNNYFHTEERAKEVAEKIKTLLKMERIHDMLCPDYKPDWNDGNTLKCNITMDYNTGTIESQSWYFQKMPVGTCFPKDKIQEAIKLYKEMS